MAAGRGFYQPSRHDQEIDQIFDPVFFELFNLGQVLLSDFNQRDGSNVELLPFDEMQQQIEWARKNGEGNLVGAGHNSN